MLTESVSGRVALEFDWSQDDLQHRQDIREFLDEELPELLEEEPDGTSIP